MKGSIEQLTTNMHFRSTPMSMTLDDLELL